MTTVNPGPIKTDFFTIADKEGGYVKSVGRWMLDADHVAERITSVILTDKREMNLPRWMSLGTKLYQLFPSFTEKLVAH